MVIFPSVTLVYQRVNLVGSYICVYAIIDIHIDRVYTCNLCPLSNELEKKASTLPAYIFSKEGKNETLFC
jgi:hypothetical protein